MQQNRHFHISLSPFVSAMKHYNAAKGRADLMAGVTVAVFAIPQAMAYAMLAGFPPVYGLYSAIVLSILAALWGSSELVNTGPTNSAALLTAAAMTPFFAQDNLMEVLFLFTLLVGVIRLLLGLFKFGQLIDYVPESAFLGFTVGAGLLIALGQLHHLFGVEGSNAAWFPRRMWDILQHASALNPYTLAIGLGTLAGMLALNRFAKRIPVALIIITLGTGLVYLLGDRASIRTVADIAPIPRALPAFQLPLLDWNVAVELLPAAFAVAIIGLIEAVSIGQVLALKHGRHLNFNQEFFGQGLSHIIGSFFQCLPGSGSFSRSALMDQCGAVTRIANILFTLATALALLALPFLLNLIPICSLAGLLLFIGYKLIDTAKIKRVWRTSKEDAFVMIITLLVTVFLKIEYGIYVGVILSALLFIHRAKPLKVAELLPEPGDRFREVPYDDNTEHEPSDIIAVGLCGDLFYGQSMELRDLLNEIIEKQHPRVLILRARRAYSIDFSCWSALFDVAEIFEKKGGKLYLCGVRPDYHKILGATGKQHAINPTQVYASESALFSGLRRAVDASREHLPEAPLVSEPWKNHLNEIRD